MLSDRITEDRDWRDGMNAFRIYARQEIEELKEEIILLKQQLNRENINGAISHKDSLCDSGSEGLLRGGKNGRRSSDSF